MIGQQCAVGSKVLRRPKRWQQDAERIAARQKKGVGLDYPATVVGTTPDGRCQVCYDASLGASGLANAQAVLGWAPAILDWHDRVFGYVGGKTQVIVAPLSSSNNGSGGAYHYGCDFASGGVLYLDGAAGNNPLVAGLFAAKLSEAYMGDAANPQKTQWNCGYSNGEGLSRRCADEVVALIGAPGAMDGYSAASAWNVSDDWVSQTEQTDGNYDSIGCAVLAIDWLVKTGYPLYRIAQAPGDTLEDAYRTLTGQTGLYAVLKAAVTALPGGVAGIKNDFPFSGGPNPTGAAGGASPSPVPAPQPAPQPPPAPPGISVAFGSAFGSGGYMLMKARRRQRPDLVLGSIVNAGNYVLDAETEAPAALAARASLSPSQWAALVQEVAAEVAKILESLGK